MGMVMISPPRANRLELAVGVRPTKRNNNASIKATTPGPEEREADKPKGRIIEGPLPLVEVHLGEHAGADEAVPEKPVGHASELGERTAASSGQGDAIMSEFP